MSNMSNTRQRHTSWCNIPNEIIQKISRHLQTRQQMIKFRSVCRKWRKHSLPIPTNIFPLTLPLPIPIPFRHSNHPLILQECSIHLITSSVSPKPWMIMTHESNSGRIQLHHPLTRKRVKNFPTSLDMTRFRASKLVNWYNFKNYDDVHKVLLCSSTSSYREVLVLYGKGVLGKLSVRITNEEDDDEEEKEGYSWEKLKARQNRKCCFFYLDDVIKYKEMVYAIDRNGRLYVLDTKAMNVERVLVSDAVCKGNLPDSRRKRLVVDDTRGKLYMVVREHMLVEVGFTIYKFNMECKRWDEVVCLGSKRVLFVGLEHCFFGKTKDFPGCKGNCIVFGANCFTQYCGSDSPDQRLFGNKDVDVGVYELDQGNNFSLLSSVSPEFSEVIWPPPSWFSHKIKSNEFTMFSSSVVLIHRRKLGCGQPWIVSSVEVKGKTKLFHPFLGETLPNVPEDFFIHQFNPYYLAVNYHMAANGNDNDCLSLLVEHEKVLLLHLSQYQSFPCTIKDCSVLVLYRGGHLVGYKYGAKVSYSDISYGFVDKFDDILCFDGVIYALDRLGKLYNISPDTFVVSHILVDRPVVEADSAIRGWRKRLVASPWDDQLYLVVRDDLKDVLEVYKLSKCSETWIWVRVQSFVDGDQVLFLSRVNGFFALADEFRDYCQLSNCILFYDAFPSYFNITKPVNVQEEIQVFWLGGDTNNLKPISSYPGFPAVDFFNIPNWIWQARTSSNQSHSQREIEEDEDVELVTRSGASLQEHVSSPAFEPKCEEQTSEIPPSAANFSATAETVALQQTVKSNSDPDLAFRYKEHNVGNLGNLIPNFLGVDFTEEKTCNAISTPVTPSSVLQTSCQKCSSTVEFNGICIKSDLLPTLQIIWDKHGSLFDEESVRSKDLRACALESVAKLKITLQNTTGRSLTDSQVDEMQSVLFDLQRLGLKVDWLVQVVNKAVTLQKTKPLIESIMELEKKKAEVDKEEKEFLAWSAKVKQELEDDRANLYTLIPFPELEVLDDCLGDGL